MVKYEEDYRITKITARDIVLLPFYSETDSRKSSLAIIEETSRKSAIESEESPLEGIPFVTDGSSS